MQVKIEGRINCASVSWSDRCYSTSGSSWTGYKLGPILERSNSDVLPVFSEEYVSRQTDTCKRRYHCQTAESYWDKILLPKFPRGCAHGHEVIPKNSMCKFFLDIDKKLEKGVETDEIKGKDRPVLETTLKFVFFCVGKIYEMEGMDGISPKFDVFNPEQTTISSACRPEMDSKPAKISYHVTVNIPGFRFENVSSLKLFLMDCMDKFKLEDSTLIDLEVYKPNGSLKMVFNESITIRADPTQKLHSKTLFPCVWKDNTWTISNSLDKKHFLNALISRVEKGETITKIASFSAKTISGLSLKPYEFDKFKAKWGKNDQAQKETAAWARANDFFLNNPKGLDALEMVSNNLGECIRQKISEEISTKIWDPLELFITTKRLKTPWFHSWLITQHGVFICMTSRNHYCSIKGSEHSKNHVYYSINLKDRTWWQGCFNSRCKQTTFMQKRAIYKEIADQRARSNRNALPLEDSDLNKNIEDLFALISAEDMDKIPRNQLEEKTVVVWEDGNTTSFKPFDEMDDVNQ